MPPLPSAGASITKTVEGTNTAAGYKVLYTIKYYAVNTLNFTITDPIPPQLTFLQAYNGGTLSGSDVVWNFGDVVSPVSGSVSWMAQVNAGVPDGTDIINTASYSSTELGSAASNSVTMTTGINPALSISKSVFPGAANIGDTVAYTLTYNNDGYVADTYVDFENPLELSAGWTEVVTGGTWNVAGGILTSTAPGTYPKLVKDAPVLHDGIFQTDAYVPSTNGNGDAVLIFNLIDKDNQYHARFQADAHEIDFDRVVGNSWQNMASASDPTINYNKWYTIKVEHRGTNIKIKVWDRTKPEPAAWAINTTESSPALQVAGRTGYQSNTATNMFDNLEIFGPGPAMNTRIYDTLPACITFLDCTGGCTQSGGMVRWDFPEGSITLSTRRCSSAA